MAEPLSGAPKRPGAAGAAPARKSKAEKRKAREDARALNKLE